MKKFYTTLVSSLFFTIISAQVTQLTTGLNVQGGISDNNKTFFATGTGAAASTDGTVAGMQTLAQFFSNPKAVFFGGNLLFNGWSPVHGVELWTSDGTVGGTAMLKDIYPGTDGSYPGGNTNDNGNMLVVGNKLFFTATTAAEGTELWKSDGTPTGTVLLKEFVAGAGSANIFFTRPNGRNFLGDNLFFVVASATALEIWKSDGTTSGTTVIKSFPLPGGSFGQEFVAVGTNLFFLANDGMNGAELWKTDGTPAGTMMVKDINPGVNSAFNLGHEFNYLVADNNLFFLTTNGSQDLWKTDGTTAGTQLVTSFNYADLKHAVLLNNKFYFAAANNVGTSTGNELWVSDGTAGGTALFKDIYPGPNSADPRILLPMKAGNLPDVYDQFLLPGYKFLFFANDGTHGNELWVSDGTLAGTFMVKDVNPGMGSCYTATDSTYSGIFFTGTAAYLDLDNGTNGYELWTSNGTTAGTTIVADINPGVNGSNPNFLGMVNRNILIFQGRTSAGTIELFRLDALVTTFPVKLMDFTATARQNAVLLEWTTADELNTRAFNIQRSADGKSFESIGSVAARGGSGLNTSYTFADNSYSKKIGRIFYRLEIEDKDGSKYYSQIRVVSLSKAAASFAIIPNPVRNDALLQLNNISGTIELKIVSLSGQVLAKQNHIVVPGSLLSISTALIPPGVYVISIESNGVTTNQQFIKQ